MITLVLLFLMPILLALPWRRIARGSSIVEKARHGEPAGGRHAHEPKSDRWTMKTAIRTVDFWLLAQCFFFTACAVYSVIVQQAVVYLVDQGYPPISVAFSLGMSGMLSIAGVISSGWLCSCFGYRFTATLSFALTFTGVLGLFAFSSHATPVLVLVYVLTLELSHGARGPIVSARVFALGAVRSIFGIIFMAMSFGAAVGSWMSVFLHDLTGGYHAAFVFSWVSVVAAVSPFWYSRRLINPGSLAPPGDVVGAWTNHEKMEKA